MRLHPVPRRTAFTLVELLTVISILGILAALAIVGTGKVIEGQRQRNSEGVVHKVHETLQRHWAKVVKDSRSSDPPSAAVLALADNDPARAKVIWTKFRLLEAFPVSYGEINTPEVYKLPPSPLPQEAWIPQAKQKNNATYKVKLVANTALTNPETQSSACLLLALSVDRGGTLQMLDKDIADSDGDGQQEIVDNWGKALKFYRFPTGSQDLQQTNPANAVATTSKTTSKAIKYSDPLDPDGTLMSSTWTDTNRTTFETMCHKISAVSKTPPAYYILPVLVSAGRDQLFGLDANLGTSNAQEAEDNIFSYKLR